MGIILGLGEFGSANGAYRFGISDLNYDRLMRGIDFDWQSHRVIGGRPVKQFIGTGDETMEFEGTMFPLDSRLSGNGLASFETMRRKAGNGVSYPMATNNGMFFGHWIIVSINDVHTSLALSGQAQKIDFTISMNHSGEGSEIPYSGALW
ncbi:MAG: hypothetical protein DSY80_06930 [Desulfocapsa sp.]|nr:MAG: hypothetical protein DSY80_06930 [Desulfocapsa sp.]